MHDMTADTYDDGDTLGGRITRARDLASLTLEEAASRIGVTDETLSEWESAAVAFEAGKPLEVTTVQLEGPRAGEVLVEIKATGMYATPTSSPVREPTRRAFSRPFSAMRAPASSSMSARASPR
jgi:DNA-binding XRE family transcriptional regulator